MKKIIHPANCETIYMAGAGYEYQTDGYKTKRIKRYAPKKRISEAFCEINFDDGNLSIHGVIGPRKSGNCDGSAGQCSQEIRLGTPAAGWTKEMLEKLCNVWDRWHLNDLNPCCEHQRELGWIDQAETEITLYHYHLKMDVSKKRNEIKNEAMERLKSGDTVTLSPDERKLLNLDSFIDCYSPIGIELERFYEMYSGIYGTSTEQKRIGWVRFEDDERGLLCKPCPVCGYKYGTSWKKEVVPDEVVEWLFSLPDTDVTPAWV